MKIPKIALAAATLTALSWSAFAADISGAAHQSGVRIDADHLRGHRHFMALEATRDVDVRSLLTEMLGFDPDGAIETASDR